MAKQDEQRLLVKIATLYYLEGRKQSDIAQLLSLSQSFVSRAITRCQKEGVVKISVVQPSNIFLKLEKGLEDRYGLKQAVVVDTEEEASDHTIKRAIGSAAAHYLETRLRPKDLIGVSSWSSTIRAMVDEVHAQNLKASGVIQLLGGVGPNGKRAGDDSYPDPRPAPELRRLAAAVTEHRGIHGGAQPAAGQQRRR